MPRVSKHEPIIAAEGDAPMTYTEWALRRKVQAQDAEITTLQRRLIREYSGRGRSEDAVARERLGRERAEERARKLQEEVRCLPDLQVLHASASATTAACLLDQACPAELASRTLAPTA